MLLILPLQDGFIKVQRTTLNPTILNTAGCFSQPLWLVQDLYEVSNSGYYLKISFYLMLQNTPDIRCFPAKTQQKVGCCNAVDISFTGRFH